MIREKERERECQLIGTMSDDYGSTQRLDRDSSTSASRSAASRDNTDRKPDSFCVRWRWWIRPTIITVYMLFVLFALPLLIYNSIKDGFQRNDQLVLIAGLSVLATIPMSVWHIVQHMLHYTKPVLQKHIVRILWMVPIYALNAVSHSICATDMMPTQSATDKRHLNE